MQRFFDRATWNPRRVLVIYLICLMDHGMRWETKIISIKMDTLIKVARSEISYDIGDERDGWECL